MSLILPAEIVAQAPLVWRRNSLGVGVRVRDPRWIKARMEKIAQEQREIAEKLRLAAEREAERRAHDDVWRPSEMNDEQFAVYARGYCAAVKARLVPMCKSGGMSFSDIVFSVSIKHDLSESEIRSKSRERKVVNARQEVMWIARVICRLSLPRIGRYLGGMDHTTVLNGVNKHQERLDAAEATR